MADPFAPLVNNPKPGTSNLEKDPHNLLVVMPVPIDAPQPDFRHPRFGTPSSTWTYRNQAMQVLGYVCRFDYLDDKGEREKIYQPLTLCRSSKSGKLHWDWRGWPTPRPIYGLDRLATRPHAPVLICEGEKSADAAGRLLPDYVTVTSSFGCNSTCKTDWAPLRRRDVTIWPDNDDEGVRYARDVVDLLVETLCVVLVPPDDNEEGWDAADAEAEGWDTARAMAFCQSAGIEAKPKPNSHDQTTHETANKTASETTNDTVSGNTGEATKESTWESTRDWKDSLLVVDPNAKSIRFLRNVANVITALRQAPEWQERLGYDLFRRCIMLLRPAPWEAGQNDWRPRSWTERDDVLTTNWMQHQEIDVLTGITAQAVDTVARDREFHPILDYLGGLQWDGVPRVATWLSRYLGVDPLPYAEAVGQCMLVAAVARVREPGCKADNMVIFEGLQGTGKSSAMGILGGEWFTDEVTEFGSKDAAMQVAAYWIIEISELDAMRRAEVSHVKAFISRTTDRFRPPYGRRVVESPRQCVFVGTTNQDEYLKDDTGARRFWPVAVRREIDLRSLRQDRDQLWAEAVRLYQDGTRWWLTGELAQAAAGEQADRHTDDAWLPPIAAYVEPYHRVTIDEIFEHCLGIDRGRRTHTDKIRIGACLKSLGWEKHRSPRFRLTNGIVLPRGCFYMRP